MQRITDLYHSFRRNFLWPSISNCDWKHHQIVSLLSTTNPELNSLGSTLHHILHRERLTNAFSARAEIDRIKSHIENDDPSRLELKGYKVYSQGDEDGILEEIFRRLSLDHGVFCEIGVEWGLECNSLYLLHKQWKGIWIEGSEEYIARIKSKFSAIIPDRLQCGISFVTAENINQLLSQHFKNPDDLDFISIDIDGNDIYLFEALEFRPKVVCIEYNSKFPPPLRKQQLYNPNHVWQGTDYFGASLSSICDAANRKGYSLVGTNIVGTNAFLVRDDMLENKFNNVNDCSSLYNPPRYYLLDHYQMIGHPSDFGPYLDMVQR